MPHDGEDVDPVRGVRRLRFAAGVLVCFVLPAGSWIEGSRLFAWAMYSRAGEYRIELVTRDTEGRAHQRNPAILAAHAALVEGALLTGTDHWREGPSMAPLRAHLDELAGYACSELGAASIEVTLRERAYGTRERATTQHRDCGP